jgi:hypothetical protein
LIIEIRKRLGLDYWQSINENIIKHNAPENKADGEDGNIAKPNAAIEPTNQGSINLDATIVEQDIQYPTDSKLKK